MLFVTLTLTIFLLLIIFKWGKNIVELVIVSLLLSLGILGLIPFIITEYIGFNYTQVFELLKTITYFLLFVTSFLFILFVKIKRIQLSTVTLGLENKHRIPILILTALFIIRGYYLPMLGWDAYALYDARALMYSDGLIQSQLVDISLYDSTNSLYYFAYPPMTSILHALLYYEGFESPMILYGIFFVIYMLTMYLIIVKSSLNNLAKSLLFIVSVFNPMIVEQTNIAYTNLPTITFQVVTLYLILNSKKQHILCNSILVGLMLMFSNWTRVLEPYYIAFLFAWIFLLIKMKINLVKKCILIFTSLLISIFSRNLWHGFVEDVIGSSDGFVLDFGLFFSSLGVGLSLSNLIDVAFYLYTSLVGINIYIFSSVIIVFYLFMSNKLKLSNIFITTAISTAIIISITVLGTLYFSIAYTWWDKIPGSLLRSNMILVPLLSVLLSGVVDKKTRSNKTIFNK